jgi:hypothetical protein
MDLLKFFFASRTEQNNCRVPQSGATTHYRGVSNWELQRVARPGQPADNESVAAPGYTPRRQVWITRLGTYTRVVLVAHDGEPDSSPTVSKQSWA